MPDGRARHRRVQHRAASRARGSGAAGDRDADRRCSTATRSSSSRRRRAGRRRLGDRHADRRRDPALRAPGDARGRRARPRAAPYRGRDIQWWMDAAGVLDERYDEVDDICGARATCPRCSSWAIAGPPERSTSTRSPTIGVKLVGRLAGIRGRQGAVLRLAAQPVRARRPQDEPAARHDRRVGARRTASSDAVDPPHRFEPTRVEASPPLGLDLARGGIRTILWATGFRPDYSWLDVPVLDRKGHVRHDGGVVGAPACTSWACRSCGAASRASSTAPATMRAI